MTLARAMAKESSAGSDRMTLLLLKMCCRLLPVAYCNASFALNGVTVSSMVRV